MEKSFIALNISCKTTLIWRTINSKKHTTNLCKTLTFTKPTKFSASVHLTKNNQAHPFQLNPHDNFLKDKVVNFNQSSHKLQKTLLEKLKKHDSDPVQILKDDGDWSKEQFWVVINFLKGNSRAQEIPKVFDSWKQLEDSRINEFNYSKIIRLLVEKGIVEDAILVLGEMRNNGIKPSLEIYNVLIHGFAQKGRFEDALFHLKDMEECDLKPDTETYDGLVKAYGHFKMYDEMGQLLKNMKDNGCIPDYVTYNLLIREFSKAGLLKKMESTYHSLVSRRMDVQSSTLIAMLEAYANFGILDKMEKFYGKVLKSKTSLKEDLVRKLVRVYLQNKMYSRVDHLAFDLSLKAGKTDLVWCLRMLSHACILSRKGMDSVFRKMESDRVPWNVTVANIVLLAYLKMKDLKRLHVVLAELSARNVKPDLVTVGVLFDAFRLGFDGKSIKIMWRRMRFFDEPVELNTDAVVFAAFGKGHFLKKCEEMYSSLDSRDKIKKMWTYRHLVKLVFEHNKELSQTRAVEPKSVHLS